MIESEDKEEEEQQQQQDDQQSQISVEYIFQTDVVNDITKHLNIRDLCRLSQVSKFSNEFVEHDFSERKPRRLLLPDIFDKRLMREEGNDFEVYKMIGLRPDITILFCGPRPHMRSVLNLEYNILTEYKQRLPNRIIVLGVDISMMNDEEIRSAPTEFGRTKANGIQALLLSKYRQLEITVASCESYEKESTNLAHRMIRQLLPEDLDEKSTLLCFGRTQFSTCRKVLKLMQKTFKPNTFNLWGFSTTGTVKMIDCNKDDYPGYLGMESFIGLRISGPNLKSYSFVYDLWDDKSQPKLAEFAKKIESNKNTIALYCGPRHSQLYPGQSEYEKKGNSEQQFVYMNYKDIAHEVKSVIPTIEFVALFHAPDDYSFGLDSTSDSSKQDLFHKNSVSMIILTFD